MDTYLKSLPEQLALTVSFFTRISIPEKIAAHIDTDETLASSVIMFPIVGLMIAAGPALIWFSAIQFLPALVAAGLAIAFGLFITGALHEDGLADCADGLGGSRDRTKSLEIMRDSRIGAFGSLALMISVGLRWVALASLGPLAGVLALFICHSGARAAIAIALQFSTYARPRGLGNSVEEGLPKFGLVITSAFAAVIAVLLGSIWGLIALAAGFASASLVLLWLQHRLGGYTGDGLGAMQQVAEISILILLVGFWA